MDRYLVRVSSRTEPLLGHIQDISHQVWFLQDQTLVAVPRKHGVIPVTIALISCKYPETLEKDKGNPIYLGLKEPELCLSCSKVNDQPTLQLMEQNILDLYNQTEPVKSFLFYHNQNGRTSTFESVAFPGWFIAVSSEDGCPLIITQDLGKTSTTDFVLSLQ
ncbi:interleukin-36 alpha [Orycteropus afer afer]|uniref:Interleukin-1 n=1 Tax=Orycteropus afer afer TaxID=1230840 RepID=A0A8B7BCG4_ORYAF|nr:interleukin-36 alpha [Orycteropus afer afer]